MKKLISLGLSLTGLLCLLLIIQLPAIAHEKVVVVPLHGSITKIPNNPSPCTSTIAGAIRWSGVAFEGCNGTEWTPLSPIPTVYSAGYEWMDRNLGAGQIPTSLTDTEGYGDLYQWGRFSDGHEKRNSNVTAANATSNKDVPGHSDFILVTSDPFDWRNPQKDTLWQNDSDLNNPCPPGFRLPTETEFNAERATWSSTDITGAYGSPLKLIAAGFRHRGSGSIQNTGDFGGYWTSTVDGTGARYLSIDSSSANVIRSYRAFGYSVRCLKD